MKNVWRFIHTGYNTAAYNMAVDEAILTAHSAGAVPPTLRFYQWLPAALTIGYFQKAKEEIDFSVVQEKAIGFVRRPTGGRAVLHDQELTYSMTVSETYPGMPNTVNESYRVLSEGLVLGFRRLGLQAEMVHLGSEPDKVKFAIAESAACFDSPSWYELVVEGQKVAGSAQTRQKGVILQHGSILLELDIELLFSLLRFPNERVRTKLKQSFSKKAVAVNELLRRSGLQPVGVREVEDAFRAGISDALQIEWVVSELTEDESILAYQLSVEKYGSETWNFRR